MQISWKNPLSALPVLLLLAAHAGAAWGLAGNVQFVSGDVKIINRAGETRALQKGAEINEGDRVVTGDASSAQIKMVDGGFIAIRPNTDMGFDTYRFSGREDGTENAIMSLLQGGFRTITGIIGRSNKHNYLVKTVTSTIGIRGTDHEPMVILAPRQGQAAIAPPGTYDKVNVGIAFIRNEGGTIDIHRNQVGYAPDAKAPPRILPSIPSFFKPTPPPGPQKGKGDAKDEGKKEGAPAAAAATAPAKSGEEQKAASGEIRSTAVVDPTSTVTSAPATSVTVAPPVAPTIAIQVANAAGTTLNLTTQTKEISTGIITPPPAGPPAFVPTPAVPIVGGTGNYRQVVYSTQTIPPGTFTKSGTYTSVYNLASGVMKSASNYLFDASGNLASIQSSDYRLSDRGMLTPPSYSNGALPYTGTPGDLPSSPLAGAAVSFSGGTTPDGNYNDTVNGIRLGRYAGGTVTTTDFSTLTGPLIYSTPMGSNSLNWAVREIPGSIPINGSFEYKPAYATKPTDSLGNVGTLNYASLAANFTTQTVSPAVGITINNQTLSAAATNVPLDSTFGFDVSSSSAQNPNGGGALRVNCFGSNCAPPPAGNPAFAPVGTSSSNGYSGYGGRITGGLAGAGGTAGGAFFRYLFDTYYNPLVAAGSAGGIPSGQTRPVNDYINGLVGFTQGVGVATLAPATATSGGQAFSTAYFSPALTAGGFLQYWDSGYRVSSTGYTNPFGAGSPNMVDSSTASSLTPSSETLTGATVVQAPTNANSFAATGISFGRYTGGTVTGTDNLGASYTRTNVSDYAWIKGPDVAYPAAALTASATYKFDGGTSGTGTTTVNSAVLAVNFSAAAVGVDLSASGGGHTWTATTTTSGVLTGTPAATLGLNQGRTFFGSSYQVANPQLHQSLFVTYDASAPNAPGISGQINGQLMGYNLSGAGMAYSFLNTTAGAPGTGVDGSVAFALDTYTSGPVTTNSTGSAIATQTTTLGTSAIDMNSVPYQIRIGASGLNGNTSATSPALVDDQYLTFVRRTAEAVGRTPLDATSGLPTAWDSITPITPPTCTGCTPYVVQVPARLSIDPSSFVATGVTPTSVQVALPAGKSPATLLESGFDAATGMRWGRYGAGVIAVFDRATTGTNAPAGAGFTPYAADATTQSWHTIQGPTQTGPTVLPITGTYTYTNIGGTHPTDNLGSAAGTLNAATLVADFGAQKVNAGVNVSVNGQTWNAGANAMPITLGQNFGASRNQAGVGPLNVNVCSGTGCSTTTTIPTASSTGTSGSILGAFNGTTGQGAGMVYSLNKGGVTGTTVTGVTAFKR